MKKTYLLFLTITILVAACSQGTNSNRSANSNAQVKRGQAPVADSEVAVIEMETPAYGTIKMELYSNIAPKAVQQFKELAREGFYNGIAFHRINASVIQAGDSNTKPGAAPATGAREGASSKPNVPAEFSDVPYTTGLVKDIGEFRRYVRLV